MLRAAMKWKTQFPLHGACLSCCLLIGSACSNSDPFYTPVPLYYFASYPVGKNPTTVTTADFNADGFTDIITTNISSNTLSLLVGNCDGNFQEQVQLRVCREPRALAISDFNLD